MLGWGAECANPKQIICTWEVTVIDVSFHPVTLEFDIANGSSPLIVGLDITQHADTCIRQRNSTFSFRRPTGIHVYSLRRYVTKDRNKNERSRLQLVPHKQSTVEALMNTATERQELNMAKNP